MVSYYNSLSYSQKYPPGQPWFPSNYHPPPNHQFLSDVEAAAHHQHMYYNPHMFAHQTSTPDWHAPDAAQNGGGGGVGSHQPAAPPGGHHHAAAAAAAHAAHHHHHHMLSAGGNTQLNESASSDNNNHLGDGLPSPPITVSGSEISSPGAPASASSPHGNHHILNRASPVKSPYYDWMKKPAYPAQPTPGKTRTKDKYRVVYTDYQRLELEKEYCTSRYITIRRKTELAQSLQLSERQVKIWFQNRRAKERKQSKKRDDPMALGQSPDLVNYMDTKPKLEPGLHLQHSLHQMSSMAMGMPPMSLHHSVLHHGHHPLAVPPPPQHLHQAHAHHQMTAPVGALSM